MRGLKYHSLCGKVTDNCICININRVKEIPYLGTILNSKVTWKRYIDQIKNVSVEV